MGHPGQLFVVRKKDSLGPRRELGEPICARRLSGRAGHVEHILYRGVFAFVARTDNVTFWSGTGQIFGYPYSAVNARGGFRVIVIGKEGDGSARYHPASSPTDP